MMKSLRDSLQARIAARHEAKSKADEQRIRRVSKNQDIMELRDRLTELKRKTAMEKTKVQQSSSDLKAQTASLNLAFVTVYICLSQCLFKANSKHIYLTDPVYTCFLLSAEKKAS
jgi:hypothetical protein